MEWTMKIMIAAVLGLIAVLILAAVISGWGGEAKGLIDSFTNWVNSFFQGRPTVPSP